MPTIRDSSGDPEWLQRARDEGRIVSERRVAGPPPTPVTPTAKPTRRSVRTDTPARIVLEVDVPIHTVSEANAGGALRNKIARKGEVKAATTEALPNLAAPLPLPAIVTLTRFGVRRLDGDNLQRSLKAVRDVVAAWLGIDDADPRVKWVYRQRAAWVPHVRIRFVHRGEAHG